MIINFYIMCNILFDLKVERFTFPVYTRFNATNSTGLRVFDLESIKTFYEDEKKYISIYLQNDVFLNVLFEDEENIKYFKQSTIDFNKEHLLSLLFGGRCVNV